MEKTNKNKVKEFIRVDHAGERGAIKIYEGQLLALNTFIKESLVCDLNSTNTNLTKEALLDQLKEITVSCKDATFKIFGLSLATFNIFISLIITSITVKLFLSYEKNK